ncbi:MAG: putative cobaltochelatase [Deltaproteobacteria bacterium]|nr:putative cobaltochelatase [Deltaproteobacteria bacterium]
MSIDTFPFPAIVGQEELKLALLLNAVNPRVEGVLIRGEKGTAKSTAVRALAALLPEIEVLEGCFFSLGTEETDGFCKGCRLCEGRRPAVRRPVQVVTLPLNATEDRVVGGIDFEKTIRTGQRKILPGLLARCNHGILYVDEVNLLDDHIVDIILSAAASGVNTIEREGVSFSHPAHFILIGTMNPEEGEIRPQFLDRFGLCVEVKAEKDRRARVITMERRDAFDENPSDYVNRFDSEVRTLRERILRARLLLSKVLISGHLRVLIGEVCAEARVAGHRADLVMEQAARALTAFSERTEVTKEDILRVAHMVLLHRQREASPPQAQDKEEEENHGRPHDRNRPEETDQEKNKKPEQKSGPAPAPKSRENEGNNTCEKPVENPEKNKESETPVNPETLQKIFEVGATFRVKPFSMTKDRVFRRGSGRRSRSRVNGLNGRYVMSTLPRGSTDVALDATLRAAAPHQRGRRSACAIAIEPQDIRIKIRERRLGNFLLFVVDASGSMGARGRMVATKGAIMSLLLDAYQKRDKVAMISFNKAEAKLALPPTSSIDIAARMLTELPVGGRTPLNSALVKTGDLLRSQFVRDPTSRPIVVLITDGRSNVSLNRGKPMDECIEIAHHLGPDKRVRFIVVDTEEQGLVRFGMAGKIAEALGARYFQTEGLKADTLVGLVKQE